jgi:excisionase family DNA binding protein
MRSYSIEQWCELHDFSRSFFYKLASQGEAPRTFSAGASRRISEEANREWIAAREALAA